MTKKFTWLDKFAQDQAAKMNKTASTIKKAEQAIVDADQLPGATDGQEVEFMGEKYKVVNSQYSDDKGTGVLIEKVAAYEGLEQDPMGMSMGAPATSVAPSAPGQTYHYDLNNNTQQTYDNDQDAQWGSSSAAATEQMIAGENATDRTTIPGKFTKPPGLNAGGAPMGMDMGMGAAPMAAPTATPDFNAPLGDNDIEIVDEAPATDAPATLDAPVTEETPVEEVPVAEEAPVEETPIEEDVQLDEEDLQKGDKLASNRIFARIFNSRKN